jgi:hypothetical protein
MSGTDRRTAFGKSASDSEFNTLKFTCLAASNKINELPNYDWSGKYVTIRAVSATAGAYLHYAFSRNASATVDPSVAATDAGASASVGKPLPVDEGDDVRLMYFTRENKLYFVRRSSADCTVYITLSDEPDPK